MVESKLVELVVAGSNPVGHPILLFRFLSTAAVRLRLAYDPIELLAGIGGLIIREIE
jgi:hypothetical protein